MILLIIHNILNLNFLEILTVNNFFPEIDIFERLISFLLLFLLIQLRIICILAEYLIGILH